MKDKFFSYYEILSEGEVGNTYTVFRAKNISNGQPVIVKFLRGDLSLDRNILENYFIKEVENFRLLIHPNILKILDYGKTESSYYLVYEFFESRTLLDIFKAKEELPTTTIEYMAKQIIRGLNYASGNSVLHRDLKPLNILVGEGGKVKISDFSILESSISKALSNTVTARRTLFLGSPLYISPEQALGLKIDFKSDIYSFGILLFEMLTGKTPFNSDTSWGLLYKHIKEIPPDLKKIKENIPEYLNYIFKRSLSKSQAKRFNRAPSKAFPAISSS
jgi:serine/threonine protein kinase